MLKNVRNKKILNVGSSNKSFYKKEQPHIWKKLMKPLKEGGNKLVNLDKKDESGVDVVSDVDKGISGKYDVILLCNLLEHLKKPFIKVMENIYEILENDGILIISCPGVYPVHEDPIDNKLRFPNIKRWVNFIEMCENTPFTIVSYEQTRQIKAPSRYGFEKLTYSTIIKCVKEKRYVNCMSYEESFKIRYFLNFLKKHLTNKDNGVVYKTSHNIRKKLEAEGFFKVKKWLKKKVDNDKKYRDATERKQRMFYTQCLGVMRQAGVVFKKEEGDDS